MMIDTNVLLDVLDADTDVQILEVISDFLADGDLFINDVIFAEISGRFLDAASVEQKMKELGLLISRLSLQDCHRAGVAHRVYRRAGGERSTILPDFLIGAHAERNGWPLITRDRKGFASYFPDLTLIDPYKVASD